MRTFLLIFLFIVTSLACNKIACGALIAGCTGVCACDFPVCECCPECAVCLGTMWESCCSCFGKCDELAAIHHKRSDMLTGYNLSETVKRVSVDSDCFCYYGVGKFSCGSMQPMGCYECCGGAWHKCPANSVVGCQCNGCR